MSGFLTFLVILGLLVVVLEFSRRRHDLFVPTPGGDRSLDRDLDRVIADLRAHDEN